MLRETPKLGTKHRESREREGGGGGARDEGRGEGGPRRHQCLPLTPSPASSHVADQSLRLEVRTGRESSRQGKRRRGSRSPSPAPTFIRTTCRSQRSKRKEQGRV
ncbi:hypothetical protein U1Q18_026281 [Sarracenia purpurea var. burkii]